MGFRPVEREEVQTPATSRIELPIMLRASPMDRGGLHTWLATRKAESDRKREEEATSANNPWLAKSYEKPQSEKKKEELVAQSSTGSQQPLQARFQKRTLPQSTLSTSTQ